VARLDQASALDLQHRIENRRHRAARNSEKRIDACRDERDN
jgi:hypothetical protein